MSCTSTEERVRLKDEHAPQEDAAVEVKTLSDGLNPEVSDRCGLLEGRPESFPVSFKYPDDYFFSQITDVILTPECKAQKRASGERFYPRFKPVEHRIIKRFYDTPNDTFVVDCVHFKLKRWWVSIPTWVTHPDYDMPYTFAKKHMSAMVDSDFTVTSSELRSATARLQPDIDDLLGNSDTVMAANFLLELREVKTLARLFSIKYKNIFALAGDKFLGINFGVLPLVGDIDTLSSSLDHLKLGIKRWNEMADKKSIMTFKATIFDHKYEETYVATSTVPVSYQGNLRIHTDYSLTSIAKLHLYATPIRISHKDETHLLKQLYGFDKPLSVVWEAVPFSFVIDWFVNIQNYIETMEEKNVVRVQPVDFGYSVKSKRKFTSSGLVSTTSTGIPSYEFDAVPRIEELVHYVREPLSVQLYEGFKLRTPYLSWSLLSPHQAALGAALAWK